MKMKLINPFYFYITKIENVYDVHDAIDMIKEFDEGIPLESDNWRDMAHDFMIWLYENKMVICGPSR